MSKRFGNILTARDLQQEGVDAGTVRLLLATTHYRAPLDFTDESLDAAREGSRRLGAFDARLADAGEGNSPGFELAATRLDTDFARAMDDDLNTPRALAALFEAAREGNRLLDHGELPCAAFRAAWARGAEVLQVLPDTAVAKVVAVGLKYRVLPATGTLSFGDHEAPPSSEPHVQEAWATWWAEKRLERRLERDFAESDRIRDLLAAAGWEVRDRKDGSAEVVRAGG
jgi:cysteinyl-tRNA synthetase